MNGDSAYWSVRLLFASVCVLLGLTGFVAARSSADRRITFGLLAQGILLVFVVGGAYFHRAADLRLGGLVVTGLLLVFSFGCPANPQDEQSREDKEGAEGHSP